MPRANQRQAMNRRHSRPIGATVKAFSLGGVVLFAAGCNTDMWRQPRHDALDASELFPDKMSARPLVPGTIARDHLRQDDAYFTGQRNGKLIDKLPMPVTMELLKRGRERFDIYCSPCHGRLGNGDGMIAERGFELRRPVGNYHTDRLRNMPVGHFYDVITNGYGTMFSYASRIEPQDRWAVVAYIRALQLSQHASPADADAQALADSLKPATTTHENEEAPEHP